MADGAVFAYVVSVVAMLIMVHTLSIFFAAGLVRSLRVPEGSIRNAAYYQYASRALLGVYPVPAGYLRVLCWVLRFATLLLLVGSWGIPYLAFSHAGVASACPSCDLDPANKSAAFWFGYASAVLMMTAFHAGGAMVLRWDPRMRETGRAFDERRTKFALKMIFTDALVPSDRLARLLRDACRWTIVLSVLALLGWFVASREGL
ncbi:MAG TPA: hypothetical protein VGN46_06185 [Luteibacter sp.]|jgi:hypothetical protein|uniref:hypothetical protein n=1 Tax=Luteibacter sp. TaxID=1886636 RepID=UPI002F3EAAF4